MALDIRGLKKPNNTSSHKVAMVLFDEWRKVMYVAHTYSEKHDFYCKPVSYMQTQLHMKIMYAPNMVLYIIKLLLVYWFYDNNKVTKNVVFENWSNWKNASMRTTQNGLCAYYVYSTSLKWVSWD